MSSIGSLSSSSSSSSYGSASYQSASSNRAQRPDPAQLQQQFFSQLDSDESGGVDASELQSALDALSQQSGQTASVSASDILKQWDSDGSGSIGQDELGSAMEASRPPPPPGGMGGPPPMSTADFARSHSTSTSASASASASASDEDQDALMSLDSDEDGAVSRSEFGLDGTESAASLSAFFDAVDEDGDGSITRAESSAFKDKLQAQFEGAAEERAMAGASGQQADGSGRPEWLPMAMLAQAAYGAIAGTQSSASSQVLALA